MVFFEMVMQCRGMGSVETGKKLQNHRWMLLKCDAVRLWDVRVRMGAAVNVYLIDICG